jgi:GntR family transcriptional regulator
MSVTTNEVTRRGRTAYANLADELRRALRTGEFPPGAKLPTENELAELHGLSRQTIRRAMQDLVNEGLIYRVAGRGTFPMNPSNRFIRQLGSIQDLMALTMDTDVEVVSPLDLRVDIESAGRLGLPSDIVATITVVRYHADNPICVTTAYMAPEVREALAGVAELHETGRRSSFTIFGLIEQATNTYIEGAEQSVTAVGAPAAVTKFLKCAAGEPVLRVDRQYLDSEQRPVELAISYFDPTYYSYRVRLHRNPK